MKKIVLGLISVLLCMYGFTPADNAETMRKVPVIMYHSVCKTNVGEYVVSPAALKSDFKYLKDNGYTAVFVRDVINFCNGKGDLPLKPIILSFDDGFYNNLFYVDKIAEEYGMKITVSVVGSYVEKEEGQSERSPVYSYLSPAELKRLHDGGRAEICNHTYNMHHTSPRKGLRRKRGESMTDYRNAIIEDSEKCRNVVKNSCGYYMDVFTYPFGSYSEGTGEIIKSLGYQAVLTCKGGINTFYKGSVKGLDCIMRYNRSGNTATAEFFRKIKI